MKNLQGLPVTFVLPIAGVTGGQQVEVTTEFQGKSHDAGSSRVYTLQSGSGTISGSHTYVVDSGNQVRQNTFRPAKGSLWRIQQFTKDATGPLSLQQGK